MELIIDPTGDTRCVYDEQINLASLGNLNIRRASHVEPNDQGEWMADMSPVDGPTLGPFSSRSIALEAEQRWLSQHWLEQPQSSP